MKKRAVMTRWLLLGMALLALSLALAIEAYFSSLATERESRLISLDAVPGSIDAHAMRVAIGDGVRAEALATMRGDEISREASLAVGARADAAFRAALVHYRTTILIDPERDQALVDKLSAAHDNLATRQREFARLVRSGDLAASRSYYEHELIPAYAASAAATDALVAYNHANAKTYAESVAERIRRLRWTMAADVALAFVSVAILVGILAVRRREQRQLIAHAGHLRSVLDNLFVFVGVLDLQGRMVEVNNAPLTVGGLRRDEVIGQPFLEGYWWSHSPELQERLRMALDDAREGKFVRFDLEARVAGDLRMMVDFGCGPLRDPRGRITHIVTSGVDISERQRLEQQFLRAQRMEAIGTLSSGLAHDLNNILAPILMAAGILRMTATSPREQNIITMIESGAQRGANIIRQLLTFGRGAEGAKGTVQVRHLLRDIAHIIRETFPRSIQLELSVPSDLWPIVADATQLHQMLLNLCLNARDAMPVGGKLFIVAENREIDAAAIAKAGRGGKPGPHIVLSVRDTGEGIPPTIINRIFDPFFTTKPAGQGTGLGLPSVLGIAKGHEGFVTVESEVGKGTTFTVYLPAAADLPVALAPASADALPRGRGELILLVDDEVAILEAVRALLEHHDYRVITAAEGEEALRQFIEHRDAVQLVITDLDMPVMGGPALIRSLRILESGLKVIVMSGSGRIDQPGQMAAWGAQGVLRKPCEPSELLELLQQVLGNM
jgi:PAS domain S-box-containing protein